MLKRSLRQRSGPEKGDAHGGRRKQEPMGVIGEGPGGDMESVCFRGKDDDDDDMRVSTR